MKTKFERRISFEKAHIFPCKYRNLHNIPHWHREHELVYVQTGDVTVMFDGSFLTLQAGESAFLHSEEIHSIRSGSEAIVVIVKFDAVYFRRLMGRRHLLTPILSGDYDMEATLGELLGELAGEDELGGIIADSVATRLLARILRTEKSGEQQPARQDTAEKYKALLDRINTEYAYITFGDAADFMHFSKPYFSKYFYAHAGMTFTRYLNMIRISAAAELLRQGELTVTEISQSCGFNTIRNFNRVFKELTGFTPGSLPEGYDVIQNLREYSDSGFDPTLNCTEILG